MVACKSKPRRYVVTVPESWLSKGKRPKRARALRASIAERVVWRQVERSGNEASSCQDEAE